MKSTRIIILASVITVILSLIIIFNWTELSSRFLHHDQSILHEVTNGRSTELDSIFIFITNTSSYVALAATGLVLLVSYIKRSRQLRRAGWQLLLTFLIAFVVIKGLKYSIDRVRPFDKYTTVEQLVEIDTPSFPSGHTLESVAMAAAVVLLFSNKALWAIAISWAMSVAFSRILLGVHYPSDVFAGITLGILVALLCHWLMVKLFPLCPPEEASSEKR